MNFEFAYLSCLQNVNESQCNVDFKIIPFRYLCDWVIRIYT